MVISKDGLLYPKQTIREKTRNYEDLMHDAIDDALLIFNSSF